MTDNKATGIQIEKKYRNGFDGKPIAFLERTVENPKANVLFLHGVKEHSGRYVRFAEFLNQNGLNFYAGDLRAHGNTDTPGFTAESDVFASIVMDMIVWGEELKATGLPLIIVGHSFGSFLAQSLLSVLKADLYILSGSTYMRTFDTFLGRFIAGSAVAFGSGEKTATLVERLSYGRFKKQSKNGWLSTSVQSYKELKNDKLCGHALNNKFYRSMFKSTFKLYGRDMASANKNTPILLISGADDPVGKHGAGTTRLYNEYKKHKLLVELKLFEGLKHDLINDVGQCGKIYEFIMNFIVSHLTLV